MRGFCFVLCVGVSLTQVACLEIAPALDEDELLLATANNTVCSEWPCGPTAQSSECQGIEFCEGKKQSSQCTETPTSKSCDDPTDDCKHAVAEQQQPCKTECDDGAESCPGQSGTQCSAPSPTTCIDYKTCQERVLFVTACPEAPKEICNGIDDNCDNVIDEGFSCEAGQFAYLGCGESCGRQLFGCTNTCHWESFSECVESDDCTVNQDEL